LLSLIPNPFSFTLPISLIALDPTGITQTVIIAPARSATVGIRETVNNSFLAMAFLA
jgi:hypothetical protein